MSLKQFRKIEYSLSLCGDAIMQVVNDWQTNHKVKRIWNHDQTLWTDTDENHWMGWLNIAAKESEEIPNIESLSNELKQQKITDLVVLGMGGSSLCPAMMAKTFGTIPGYPKLHVLDSTDPMQIHHLDQTINLKSTFFIVSSKSGSTLEPNIFKQYYIEHLKKHFTTPGDRFIAITDPGTSLDKLAKEQHFKAIFYGVPSIGGRYSALSNFGMVPSGLMGVDIREFLAHAKTMQKACGPETLVKNNPGVMLGIILGVCANQGKNKVTFIISPGIQALGSWLEQLIAESTGKEGKGLIPIDQEPLASPAHYSSDRVFVYIRLENDPEDHQASAIEALEHVGFVVVKCTVPNKMFLGAEMFRWEIATNVAGSIIGIDPFNQPDVEESKHLTLQLTNKFDATGTLEHQLTPFHQERGLSLFADEKNFRDIQQNSTKSPGLIEFLRAHLLRIREHDYFDISAFLEMSDQHLALLQQTRVLVRDKKRVATCLGFGPRFLHSTGQDYKGGPNTGVFIQITCKYTNDILVPDHRYTFGLVIAAQAQADFEVLAARERRILRVHIEEDVNKGLITLHEVIKQALT